MKVMRGKNGRGKAKRELMRLSGSSTVGKPERGILFNFELLSSCAGNTRH
jgi:hypothetical protein